MNRRTRIVATLGPATDPPGKLEAVVAAGLDVARINFSHGAAEEHLARLVRLRQAAAAQKRSVAVLADLPGPKLRVLLPGPLSLSSGQELRLARRPHGEGDLHITEPEALDQVQPAQRFLLDDGRLQMRVQQVAADHIDLRVEVGGTLLPNKGLNLPDTPLTLPALTKRDREALKAACAGGVDWLALSFVRSPAAATELRAALAELGQRLPILAKIERPEAVHQAAAILEAFDGIMVARGDLGVEIPLEDVPHVQKRLIKQARAAGKPVITATDMLDSMRTNPRPTRAEVSDVANAVLDGTDAVMLSGETSVGQYPVEAVATMGRIIGEAETQFPHQPLPAIQPLHSTVHDHLTQLTLQLAREHGADVIIAPTLSGRTARLVSRHRPLLPIVVPAPSEAVVRQLALVWGVQGVLLPQEETGADRLAAAVRAAFDHHAVHRGQRAVVVGEHPLEGGERIPTIRLVRVGEGGRSCEP